MARELTPWFAPNQKPVRDGRYQAQDASMRCNCCWFELEWRGGEWFAKGCLSGDRFAVHFFPSQLRRWRGLTKDTTHD